VLLKVVNDRTIWMDVDTEAHYPVFNEFRRWVAASKPAGTAKDST
jgi:hypothetical protein